MERKGKRLGTRLVVHIVIFFTLVPKSWNQIIIGCRHNKICYFHCCRFPSTSATEQSPGPSTSSSKFKGLNSKSYNSCTIRVVQATKRRTANGKVEFDSLDTMHINLKSSTANIAYILILALKSRRSGGLLQCGV